VKRDGIGPASSKRRPRRTAASGSSCQPVRNLTVRGILTARRMRSTIFPASCGSRRRAAPQLRRQIEAVEQPKFTSTPKKPSPSIRSAAATMRFGFGPHDLAGEIGQLLVPPAEVFGNQSIFGGNRIGAAHLGKQQPEAAEIAEQLPKGRMSEKGHGRKYQPLRQSPVSDPQRAVQQVGQVERREVVGSTGFIFSVIV